MIYYLVLYLTTYFFSVGTKMSRLDPDPAGSVFNWPPGSVSVSQDYGCSDPEPDQKEIFTDPQNCLP
jgi:hypothetical protein